MWTACQRRKTVKLSNKIYLKYKLRNKVII